VPLCKFLFFLGASCFYFSVRKSRNCCGAWGRQNHPLARSRVNTKLLVSALKSNKSKSSHFSLEAYHLEGINMFLIFKKIIGSRKLRNSRKWIPVFLFCIMFVSQRGIQYIAERRPCLRVTPILYLWKWRDLRRKLGLIHSLFPSIFHQKLRLTSVGQDIPTDLA